MGKNRDNRPPYLSSDDAKYSLGVHRGPLVGQGEETKLEQVESAGGLSLVTTTNRTRKEKLKRHWRRFWCLYLIGNIIFLAIFLPIFFTLIIPAISQLVLDKSDLVLVHASVMQPRPESVKLTLQSALDLKIALPVRIDPISLELFVRDIGPQDPWANITIPGMMIKGNTTLGVQGVHTPLLNLTTWTRYVHDVVFQKETALSIKGSTNSYLGVLKSYVTMNKNVVSPTLDSFKGFSISDTTILLPPRPDGTNLIGNVSLPNPSVLTIQIGDIVLDIKSGDLVIGNATVTDLTLHPGDNVVPMTGMLDLATILSNLPEVLKSQASLFKTGNLTLDTITRSVVWNGHEVPYYTQVMSELTLVAEVPLADTLKNTFAHLNITQLENYGTSSNGGGLLNTIESGLNNSNSSSSNSTASSLSSALKQNLHVRDAFQNTHPIQRDAMLDGLAGLYQRL